MPKVELSERECNIVLSALEMYYDARETDLYSVRASIRQVHTLFKNTLVVKATNIVCCVKPSKPKRGRPKVKLPVSIPELLALAQSHSALGISRIPEFAARQISRRTIARLIHTYRTAPAAP